MSRWQQALEFGWQRSLMCMEEPKNGSSWSSFSFYVSIYVIKQYQIHTRIINIVFIFIISSSIIIVIININICMTLRLYLETCGSLNVGWPWLTHFGKVKGTTRLLQSHRVSSLSSSWWKGNGGLTQTHFQAPFTEIVTLKFPWRKWYGRTGKSPGPCCKQLGRLDCWTSMGFHGDIMELNFTYLARW